MQDKHLRLLDKMGDHLQLLDKMDDFLKQFEKKKAGKSSILNKFGKAIEDLEKDVAILKADSHPSQEYICCRKCGCKIAKTKTIEKE